MKNIVSKKRKILRKIYGVLSFSTAMFVFQACYGTPYKSEYEGYGNLVEGEVKSKTTKEPIKGIKVSLNDTNVKPPKYIYTDNKGKFGMYIGDETKCNLKFEDIDSTLNGEFQTKDIDVSILQEKYINVDLDAK